MNPFSIPQILSSLLFLFLGVFIYLKNRKAIINFAFLFVCFTTFWWQFSWFFLFNIEDKASAEILVKIGHIGILLLPVAFLHFSLVFLGKLDKSNKRILYFSYFITAFFEISLFATNYVIDGYYEYFWGFYPKAGFLHPFFLLFIGLIIIKVVHLLISSIKKGLKTSSRRFQMEYILVAIIFYVLASIDFAVNYGFELYPIGFIFILIFLGIIGYAIAKYKLMDIRVVLTEFLVSVIAFVLLIQFIISTTIFEYIWKGVLLLAFIFLGYLLIKSVLNEIKRREELEDLTKKLQESQEQLKKLDKARAEFLSIASHQLRTPLSIIKGYISMMLEKTYGKLPDKIEKPLENIYNSNERLIKLVNDLLSVSRIESGKLEANFQEISLEDIVSSTVKELNIRAEEKNIYLKWERPTKTLPLMSLDQGKIRQVIFNIIDNAIRYTKKGGITVRFKRLPSLIQIEISDTGVGITKKELSRVFESFARGSGGARLSTEGIGLGLYVAKKFTEIHKGKVWAESQGENKGSTFYIELPIK